jgi:hypothetical protein
MIRRDLLAPCGTIRTMHPASVVVGFGVAIVRSYQRMVVRSGRVLTTPGQAAK